MTSKKDVIRYILRQRKNGHDDETIRRRMYVNGYHPEDMNKYFKYIDDQRTFAKNTLIVTALLLIIASSIFVTGKNAQLTGAFTFPPWATTYDCGEDYPASTRYVKDLSDCIADETATKNILFCYLNGTVSTDELSPGGINDGWYSTILGKDLSSITEIDTSALLESSIVLPWNAEESDNVDCMQWTHGTSRSTGWHTCNASNENLVFYYVDSANGDINNTYGGVSTTLAMNSSYALCYDELSCVTQTTDCAAGEYCVGRMNATSGSAWYPCDTTLDAPYYRCCTGSCNSAEMMCGERLEDSAGSVYSFNECRADGTSACCAATTDCVYNNECYNQDDTIKYEYLFTYGGGLEVSLANYTFVCSDAHWCPWGFEYDSRSSRCVQQLAACYDPTDSDYCNYIYGTDTNSWKADTESSINLGCIIPNQEGEGVDNVYNESCVFSGSYGGVDYYFYQDILVDE